MSRFPFTRFVPPALVLWAACLCGSAYGQMNVSWLREFEEAPFTEAWRVGVAVDGLYVVGLIGNVTQCFYVSKFDWNGNELWTRQPGICGSSVPGGVSAAADGVYVAKGSNSGIEFVKKYDPNGNELWTRQSDFSISAVGAAADGVYTGGSLVSASGDANGSAFLRKYDPNGNILWTRQFGLPSSSQQFSSNRAMSVGTDGVFITWYNVNGSSVTADFVSKYDFQGNEVWTRSLTANGTTAVSATSDAVYVGGVSQLGNGQGSEFLTKYDLNGNAVWTTQFSVSDTQGLRISASPSGIFFLWYGPVIGQNWGSYVSQFSSAGDLMGTTALVLTPQPKNASLWAEDIVSTTEAVYVTGIAWSACRSSCQAAGFLEKFTGLGAKLTSQVSPLPAVESSSSFTVQWSGTDSGGPGIQNYSIYVSDNGGAFTPWLTQTTATQAIFTGASGHSYGFYSIAQDSAGKTESSKSVADTTTYVDTAKPVSHVSSPATTPSPNFQVQWSGTDTGGPGIGKYNVYMADNGGPFTLWQSNTTATQAWYAGYLGHTYAFFSQATDTYGNPESLKSVADATTQTPASSPKDVNHDGQINCADISIVNAAMGSKTGASNWNAAADVNGDGVVDIRDLAAVSQMLIPGTKCN